MKKELERRKDDVFFLATENVAVHLKEPYRIKKDFIETENFVPEAFMVHSLQKDDSDRGDSYLNIGEKWMSELNPLRMETDFINPIGSPFSLDEDMFWAKDEDEDEDEWDEEEDEDWDDEDEDEDWDEDDEDWDEDEDWDDEDEDAEEEDDWEEEE